MISHDATLVRTALMQNDLDEMSEMHLEEKLEGRLSGSFKEAVDNLIEHGFVERETRQLNVARAKKSLVAYISYIKLLNVATCKKLNPIPYIPNKIASSHLSYKASSSSYNKLSKNEIKKFVEKATSAKRFNSNYQAVLNGTKARKDALQEFAKTLSRSNAADFFEGVNHLDELQRRDLKRTAARFTARSRRN